MIIVLTDEYARSKVKYFHPNDLNLLIRYLCNTCRNQLHQLISDVEFHLYAIGFFEPYTVWYYHGETSGTRNEQMNDREDIFDEDEMLRIF